MRIRWLLLFVMLATVLGSLGVPWQARAAPAVSSITPDGCEAIAIDPDNLDGGGQHKLCVPPIESWNNDLVIWAHGYVVPADRLTYQDELPDGTQLSVLIRSLGYAFAATTYPRNGLVVQDALSDLLTLRDEFNEKYPSPTRVKRNIYIVGASMGGLITTLLAEQTTGKFNGAMAACGIVGDFRRHVNYWGDFNVLFRYFFKDTVDAWQAPALSQPLPSSATNSATWDSYYKPAIGAVALTNPAAVRQLIATSQAAVDTANPATALKTIEDLAYYSYLSADDSADQLGGNPFSNIGRWYWGSDNDWRLNRSVYRSWASPQAVAEMWRYQTSGKVRIPIVMPHTTADPIVPFYQTLLYSLKARPIEQGKVTAIPVARYGHCNFTPNELVLSFALLVLQTTGKLPLALDAQLDALDMTEAEADLAAQLQAFRDSEALDARMQAEARWPVYLPLVIH